MALKNTILSWLFGSRNKGAEADELAEEALEEEQQAEQRFEDFTPQPDASMLELSRDHALYRLYELWAQQTGHIGVPILRLDDPGVLPNGWLDKELGRLRQAVTSAAGTRLTKVQQLTEELRKKAQAEAEKAAAAKESSASPDAEREKQPEELEVELPEVNAQPWIFISSDRLAAWILVFPPVGAGQEITSDAISTTMRASEITFGIQEELVNGLPEMEDRYFHLYLLAVGQPAVDGKDGRIIDFFPRKIERKVAVDENGQVDYTTLDFVQNADEGDEICQLIPHTEGVPGTNVMGKPVAARNGKKVTLPKGRNTVVNEDGTKLLAGKPGHVEFTGRSFQIEPVLNITGNVDYSTGNINFLGDVHVHGDVCTGFHVRAIGNVQIDGVLEGTVEAGKDLVVVKGILGSRESVIRAHRNVFAKYMENSSVHAQECLSTDCIVNCDVYSDGEVQVLTGRGTIIGGKVSAGRKISAKIVGSKAEGLTKIMLGGLPCAEFERELLVREITDLEEEMKKTECQPDSPAKLNRLSKARLQISVNRMKLGQMDKDMEKMREELEEQGKARLECDIAYPGTEIIIGSNSLRLMQETHKCVARLTDGEIRVL